MAKILYPVTATLVGRIDFILLIRREDDSKETPYRKVVRTEGSSYIYEQLNTDEFTATISRGEDDEHL